MSARFAKFIFAIACCALVGTSSSSIFAQPPGGGGGGQGGGGQGGGFGQGNNFGSVVGGVQIDAGGVISAGNQTIDADLRKMLEKSLQQGSGDLATASELRMISLKGLEAAINQSRESGQPLPEEVQLMAGLQRIEYVILSPENNDIIIAGPGEGFKLDSQGNVVGSKSGTPVIRLEDFLVAMRSVDAARTGQGVSVSIDPTEQGVRQLQQLYKNMSANNVSFNPGMQPEVEKAMGPNIITLTGVPADSRFSQVLVAADYKMKRLSMGLEPAPIAGLPSFMEIAAAKNAKLHSSPRFWMECSYQPIAKTADGSVWQIRGSGVRTLTEESHFDGSGKRTTGGKQNRFAVQWAELMTEKFEALAAAEPAFRELRNVMDLSVVAAIIRKENLAARVGLETPAILGVTDVIATPTWAVPKSVPAECSFVRVSDSWMVSASGGIQLDSWGVVEKTETVAQLETVASKATSKSGDRWWWNASSN